MKEPNNTQRYTIYFLVLSKLKNDKKYKVFMCNEICEAYGYLMYSKKVDFDTNKITALFPEFIAQKPKELFHEDKPSGDGDLWWDFKTLGHEKIHQMQIDVIIECIQRVKTILISS